MFQKVFYKKHGCIMKENVPKGAGGGQHYFSAFCQEIFKYITVLRLHIPAATILNCIFGKFSAKRHQTYLYFIREIVLFLFLNEMFFESQLFFTEFSFPRSPGRPNGWKYIWYCLLKNKKSPDFLFPWDAVIMGAATYHKTANWP